MNTESPELKCRNCGQAVEARVQEIHKGYCIDCVYADVPRKDAAIRVLQAALKTAHGRYCSEFPWAGWITCIGIEMAHAGLCNEAEFEIVRALSKKEEKE